VAGELAQEVEAVAVGEAQVEAGDVVVGGAQERLGVVAAAGHVDHVRRVAQPERHHLGQFGVVLDQQDAHDPATLRVGR
jgi:hypothetical protein